MQRTYAITGNPTDGDGKPKIPDAPSGQTWSDDSFAVSWKELVRSFLLGSIDCSDEQVDKWQTAVRDAEGPLHEIISFHDYISNAWNPSPPMDANSNAMDTSTRYNPECGIQHPCTYSVDLRDLSEEASDADYALLQNSVERHTRTENSLLEEN